MRISQHAAIGAPLRSAHARTHMKRQSGLDAHQVQQRCRGGEANVAGAFGNASPSWR